MMSFPSATLLLCLWLSPAIAYKLPLLDGSLMTHEDNIVQTPNNSPFGINYKWEWPTEDRKDEGTLMLARLKREIIDKKSKKGDVNPDKKPLPEVKPTKPLPKVKPTKPLPKVNPTEPPLDESSDATPYILEASSAAITKPKIMPLLNEDETTPLTDLEQTTKGTGQTLDEGETTPLTELDETTKEAGQKPKEVITTQSEDLVTESTFKPTMSKELSDITSKKYTKQPKVNPADTTASQDTSSKHTSTDVILEKSTSSSSPQGPERSPSTKPATSHAVTSRHTVTTVWFMASSAKSAAVTHITSTGDTIQTQSIMRQCMITILILAVLCTIFIITTIALAAKLSTMKQKNKLRHPMSYTEMRCISSLLPDSDQQNKPQPKRLKTFASSMEESDGDNTTLHSFLPDH